MGNKCVKEKGGANGTSKGGNPPKANSGATDQDIPSFSADKLYPELKPPAYEAPPKYAPSSKQLCARTKIDTQKFELMWTIDNFPIWVRRIENNEFSPTFAVAENKWRLCLNCRTFEGHEYVNLYLYLADTSKQKVFAGFKLAILNEDGKRICESATFYHTFNYSAEKGNCNTGRQKFIEKNKLLNDLSKSNALTLVCEVEVHAFTNSLTNQGSK